MSVERHFSKGFMLGFGVWPQLRQADIYLPWLYFVVKWGKA
jgi:hypothetical protein